MITPLTLFAAAAAASMAMLSVGAGYLLARPAARRLVPGLATAAVFFGIWYAVGAVA